MINYALLILDPVATHCFELTLHTKYQMYSHNIFMYQTLKKSCDYKFEHKLKGLFKIGMTQALGNPKESY